MSTQDECRQLVSTLILCERSLESPGFRTAKEWHESLLEQAQETVIFDGVTQADVDGYKADVQRGLQDPEIKRLLIELEDADIFGDDSELTIAHN